VSGRLKVDTWQDRDNGEERTKVVIVATGVTLIGGRDNNNEDDF
jgi:single-stranded DNA-binding protein